MLSVLQKIGNLKEGYDSSKNFSARGCESNMIGRGRTNLCKADKRDQQFAS